MKSFTVKLSDLVRPKKNIRIHTEQQLKEFERSITMFGQIRPIVIDENNVILAGNGLHETLIRMGKEEAEVYQYTGLSENQKKKLMIADNKIFSLGIENLETLNSFFEDLQGDLDIPGFDSEILRQMVSDAEGITEKLSEYGSINESEINAIKERSEKDTAAKSPSITGQSKQDPEETIPRSEISQQEEDEEATEIKRFVICPKCGDKIWL